MSHRFSQVAAYATLQQGIEVAMSVAPESGDVIAMEEVVSHLARRIITYRTLEELQTFYTDALSAVWEHGASIGALSTKQAAHRSHAAMERFLFQPAIAGDVLGSALRQVTFDAVAAISQCSLHLAGRLYCTRRRGIWRKGGRCRARA